MSLHGPFPKNCQCGASYTLEEWLQLPLLGSSDWTRGLELRNCPCTSTLSVIIDRDACHTCGRKELPGEAILELWEQAGSPYDALCFGCNQPTTEWVRKYTRQLLDELAECDAVNLVAKGGE